MTRRQWNNGQRRPCFVLVGKQGGATARVLTMRMMMAHQLQLCRLVISTIRQVPRTWGELDRWQKTETTRI